MTEEEKWQECVRSYLRITGPVFSSPQDLALYIHVGDDDYRKQIERAADADKPIPCKLTAKERKQHKEAATRWIKAMAAWARNPRNPLPGRK